jgi:hypothetical protein
MPFYEAKVDGASASAKAALRPDQGRDCIVGREDHSSTYPYEQASDGVSE